MKSNEEFIAGIYEKAAAYTEEKETNLIRVNWVAKATRIAAMAAVCLGLTGIGSLVLGNGNNAPSQVPQPANEDYGIALTSETEDDFDEDSDDASIDLDDMDVTDNLDIDEDNGDDEVYSEESNATLTEETDLSNEEDEKLLQSPEYQEKIINSIYRGIVNFFQIK